MQADMSPLPRTTLIESLAARLEEEVLAGRLPVGSKLPSEGALSASFGVSRPVVREALARLRERGLVVTVNGSGTYVRRPATEQLTEAFVRHIRGAPDGADLSDLYEARLSIELAVARLAAERRKPEHLEALEAALAAMEAMRDDGDAWAEADLGFHLAVAEATGNPYFATLLTPLATAMVAGMQASRRSPASVRAGLAAHRQLLERLRAGDADGAVETMRSHLEDSRRRYAAAMRENGAA